MRTFVRTLATPPPLSGILTKLAHTPTYRGSDCHRRFAPARSPTTPRFSPLHTGEAIVTESVCIMCRLLHLFQSPTYRGSDCHLEAGDPLALAHNLSVPY